MITREHARMAFLNAVEREAPEALEQLREGVLPKFQAVPNRVKESNSFGPEAERITNMDAYVSGKPPVSETFRRPDLLLWKNIDKHGKSCREVELLKAALVRWANDSNLFEPWLLDIALQTLFHWSHRGHVLMVRSARGWGVVPSTEIQAAANRQDPPFQFTHPAWKLEIFDSWEEYAHEATAAFNKALSGYRSQVRARAKATGDYVPPIRNHEHFDWLALYQCEKLSPKGIEQLLKSKQQFVPEDTIWKAVSKTAHQIGLTLRPSQKGRRATKQNRK